MTATAALALAAMLLAAVPAPPPGAPLDTGGFRYARDLERGTPGLAAVRLDAAVLAHSAGLADLRIADALGRQIPYLLVPEEAPLRLPLAASGRLIGGGGGVASRYRLALPFATIPACRLVLTTSSRVFARQVRVVRPPAGDRPARSGAETLATASWEHADPEAPAPELALALPSSVGRVVELVVDDADNAPLPIASVRLEVATSRLLFFVPEGSGGERLRLLYGKPELAAPRYDLSLLAGRLASAPSRPLALTGEREERSVRSLGTLPPRALFWGALVAATLALLAVLVRLLRPAPASPPAGTGRG